ncbi:MAG: hypothetical protein N4A63_13230 [Vallitalea sp.]|jgi:hypothetical protein|nr:hypothetical protein [Vallitalea sp.]
MDKYYRLILWGMAFIFINININRFDLLPDIVGYIIIMNAVINLHNETNIPSFKISSYFGIACIVVDVVTFIKPFVMYDESIIINLVITTLTQLFLLGLIFYIYEGTIRLLENEYTQLMLTMKTAQRAILILQMILIITTTLTINMSNDVKSIIVVIGVITGFTTLIIWAVNMNTVRKYYKENLS